MADLQEWQPLLAILASGPRENGTVELAEAASRLVAWSEGAGLEAALVSFTAHPHSLRLAGLVAFAGSFLYWRLLRDGRAGLALAVALALPLVMVLDLDQGRPIFSRIHSATQQHVAFTVPAAGPVEQRLLVTAHYDSKTDLLDHTARAPVEAAALPVTLVMIAAALLALRGATGGRVARALVTAAPWLALASGAAFFATLSGGAFVSARSPGALDDGAACAVALRLAERTAAVPLARTELEVILLSGEEIGTQGARALARERFAAAPDLPTAVLNLEGLGAAPDLAVLAHERFTLRSHPADPGLLARVDAVHQARRGKPLHRLGGGVTDAREFLARGIPAVTLLSDPPGHAPIRGLHSAADDLARLDAAALDEQLALLAAVVRAIDAHGL
jgi:hypothetical protein